MQPLGDVLMAKFSSFAHRCINLDETNLEEEKVMRGEGVVDLDFYNDDQEQQASISKTTTITPSKPSHVSESEPQYALPGDLVELVVKDSDMTRVKQGFVLCKAHFSIPVCYKFEAVISTVPFLTSTSDESSANVNITPILIGTSCLLYTQAIEIPVYVTKLINILTKPNGEIIQRNPRFIFPTKSPSSSYSSSSVTGITATVELRIAERTRICLETFEQNPVLGRFILRSKGQTLAIGRVSKLIK